MVALLTAAVLAAASPVHGSVFGPVVSVEGTTFTITTKLSPTGKSAVSAASAKITEVVPAPRSSLTTGVCVAAMGPRNAKGVVAAARITISQPVQGQCGGRLRFRSGTAPRVVPKNLPKPPAGGFRARGLDGAFGSVTKIAGSTLTVKGPLGSTTVTISSKTKLEHMATVKPSAITTDVCAFVVGTSTDKGVTVKAASVALSEKRNGGCGITRFGGPGR